MLLLRSLRARLLIIGVVPVLVALFVTAALTVRSVGSFSDQQRAERRAQQVREMERAATGLSRIYTRFLTPAMLGQRNNMVSPQDVNVTIGGQAYYVGLVSLPVKADAIGLPTFALPRKLDRAKQDAALLAVIDRGGAVEVPSDLVPADLQDQVVVARGIFPTSTGDPEGGAPFGMVVIARPPVSVVSPAGALRRALVPAFAVGLAVAILLALVLGLRLVRPLKRLALAARAVARGDEVVPLDTTRGDEIGMVNRAFEDMTVRLAEARDTERQFLMRVSHELRTPLTAIRGQVDALVDGIFEDEAEQQNAYAAITAESLRLNRLVSDLLDLARLQAKRFGLEADEVDLNILLDQVVTGQGAEARERDIEITLQSGTLPVIIGDGDRILQIVGNLVRNAVRWTPDEGTVIVSALAEAGRVWITVDDSGPGIAPEKRVDIFRAFYTEDGTGTGLGLAIARELALAMGGSVTVADAPQGGARFVVELPAVRVPVSDVVV
ncbi:MAG: HAMP domain-containing sensor histidine kinase [Thermoleophilia bacterium]